MIEFKILRPVTMAFCWRKTQTPDLTALQVQYRHNLYCQQHRYIIHLYITLCDFKVCDTEDIKKIRDYSFSTYAQIYGLQSCLPIWHIKIMKSLWQPYIDIRTALDPPSLRCVCTKPLALWCWKVLNLDMGWTRKKCNLIACFKSPMTALSSSVLLVMNYFIPPHFVITSEKTIHESQQRYTTIDERHLDDMIGQF